ncbi:hypothetical protein IFM89_009536 [Coptis chinensis]|uniref:Uncharacterized protein n=1 Tax=Coptis chinensis TaxID=261450 RepID=A0A835HRZ7_9MAGN|nr:hypothetical protein IFM89_009536 [Coptis chinensis]
MANTEPTRIMIAVNESSLKGYPIPSISSKNAYEWTLNKIIRNNVTGFKLYLLHVQVPEEQGRENQKTVLAFCPKDREMSETPREAKFARLSSDSTVFNQGCSASIYSTVLTVQEYMCL